MASSTKRSWRLQEFAAHASNVNCLALGHKSGRVLVTGGDDKKVNLWAVGKPNCIMSLPGHTTPVECVQFSISEELVCAGSQAGALKLWDLEAAKIFRTLTGHKAGIRCIDFHPYGDFLTTGSMDCSVRLWDIRRKGCIYTYSAHKPRVNSVKFSPDGQWVASAGEDGDVKLWDLRVGKLLKEFPNHGGAVTSVAFHPNEFLLASSSADKTVKFWDLERFALISSTEPDVGGVRCAVFSEGGECLFAGSQDRLKVYGWEPTRTHDTVPIGWGRIQDIAVAQNQLIGASFHTSMVAINVVDLKRVQPFGGAQSPDSTSFTPGQSLRKSFSRPRTREEQVKLVVKTIEEAVSSGTDPEDESLSLADIPNIGDYQEIFQPNRKLCRTPPPEPFPAPLESLENDPSLPQILQPSIHSESDDSPTSLDPLPSLRGPGLNNQEPPFRSSPNQESAFRTTTNQEAAFRGSINQESTFRGSNNQDSAFRGAQVTVRVEDAAPRGLVLPSTVTVRSDDAPSSLESLDSPTREEFVSPSTWTRRQSSCVPPAFPEIDYPVKLSNMRHSPSEPSLNRPSTAPRLLYQSRQNLNTPAAPAPKSPSPPAPVPPVANPSARPAKRLRPPPPAAPKVEICVLPPTVQREPDDDAFIPMSADRPSGLDLDDFLPRNHSQRPGFAGGYPDMSEAEVLSSVVRGHEPMMSVLGARQRSLQIVYSTMINKDMRAAVDTALAMNDRAVVVDLLEAISAKPSIWTLDICAAILPSLLELLQSKFEMYMTVGCTTLRLILRNFAPVIRSNVQGGRSHGVDISAEERYTRCKRCYDALVPIRAFLLKRQTMQGKLGQSFRELSTLMENLD